MKTEEENNELICEKLLGWHRFTSEGETIGWGRLSQDTLATSVSAPAFTTWATAGLILDALRAKGMTVHIFSERYKFHVEMFDSDSESAKMNFFEADADKAPLAIRAAALEYIRSLK